MNRLKIWAGYYPIQNELDEGAGEERTVTEDLWRVMRLPYSYQGTHLTLRRRFFLGRGYP